MSDSLAEAAADAVPPEIDTARYQYPIDDPLTSVETDALEEVSADELESDSPQPLDLNKPLSAMTDDELLTWTMKELAGGFIGGIGAHVFNQLWQELAGR